MAQILDLGKIRFQYKGDWSAATEYQFNDVVTYKGTAYVYISTAKTTGTLTSNTQFWGRMTSGFEFGGVWAAGTTYGYGSVVRYGGNVYAYTNSVASAGNLPTNTTYWTLLLSGWSYQGNWSSASAYRVGDTVTHGGILYIAVLDSTNQNPDNNTTYWSTAIQGFQFEGTYNNATAYQKNDIVTYGGNTYVALSNTTGNLPTNATYWDLFVSGIKYVGLWSNSTAYKLGESVLSPSSATAYLAIQDVPAGTLLTDTAYWSILTASTTTVLPLQSAGTINVSTSDVTLNTGIDTTQFNNVLRVTASREFASIYLPNATSATIVTTKYYIVNETQWPVAIRDNTGQLLSSLLPQGFIDIALTANGTQAGNWYYAGNYISPVHVGNSVLIPNASATATDNTVGANPVFDTRLDANRVLSAATVSTATTVSVWCADYSTVPATTSNPLTLTVANATIIGLFTVSSTRAVLFTLTTAYLLNISGTTVTSVATSTAYTSPVRTGVMGVIAVQQMDNDLFAIVFGGAANATPVFTAMKVDGDTLLSNTSASFANLNAILNGWDFAVTSTSTAFIVYGGYALAASPGTAPFDLVGVKISVTKNSTGVAPSVSVSNQVVIDNSRQASAVAYSINVVPDSSNRDLCLVTYYTQTGTNPRAFAVSNCAGSSALTAGAVVTVEAGTATAFIATALGQTYTRRNVKSVSAGKFHFIWQSVNSYTRVAKLNVGASNAITVKLSNSVPKAGTGVQSLLPQFTNALESQFIVFQAAPNAAYSGIASFTEDANEFVNFKNFNAPMGDHLSQTIASPILATADGWVLVAVAQPNTATTSVALNSVYAVFKCLPGGNVKYAGQTALPYNSATGSLYNPQFVEAGRIVHGHVANDYDYTQNIPYRRSSLIEFAKY